MTQLRGLQAGYPGRPVLEGVDLDLLPGEVLALLGPNGCGKSTLLRAACGLLPRTGGEILAEGRPIGELSTRQLARHFAYLPQSRAVPSITARRMVLHGRFPYLDFPRRYRREDYEAVDRALEQVGGSELAERFLPQLSGGQRQKVYLAMALAQDTETILMDEPTTFLDIRHQLETMALARRLAESGRAVAAALHDVCLALEYADFAAVFGSGRLLQTGTPEELFRSGILAEVMGVTLERSAGASGWRYYCKLGD